MWMMSIPNKDIEYPKTVVSPSDQKNNELKNQLNTWIFVTSSSHNNLYSGGLRTPANLEIP